MNTVIIPAKKTMVIGTSLEDIDNIWDYIDLYVEEETQNVSETYFDEEDDFEYGCYDCDDSWEEHEGSYMSDKDWDYYDAFEGEPEAVWGREW